jgi:hypothetical protein
MLGIYEMVSTDQGRCESRLFAPMDGKLFFVRHNPRNTARAASSRRNGVRIHLGFPLLICVNLRSSAVEESADRQLCSVRYSQTG